LEREYFLARRQLELSAAQVAKSDEARMLRLDLTGPYLMRAEAAERAMSRGDDQAGHAGARRVA
jgi:hypothetical protein